MIIVSDYDGTIKRFNQKPSLKDKNDLKKDIKAINSFVESNNEFIISTKRSTESIKKELEKYKILYTYITTYNGLVTFDNKEKLLTARFIDKEILTFIRDLQKNSNLIKGIEFFDEYGKTIKEKDKYVIVSLYCKDFDSMKTVLKQISSLDNSYYNISYSFDVINSIINIHMKSNKKIGIDDLLKVINRTNMTKRIVTVGDSMHDLEMINEYDGWIVRSGEIYNKNIGNFRATDNIRTLIKTYR